MKAEKRREAFTYGSMAPVADPAEEDGVVRGQVQADAASHGSAVAELLTLVPIDHEAEVGAQQQVAISC